MFLRKTKINPLVIPTLFLFSLIMCGCRKKPGNGLIASEPTPTRTRIVLSTAITSLTPTSTVSIEILSTPTKAHFTPSSTATPREFHKTPEPPGIEDTFNPSMVTSIVATHEAQQRNLLLTPSPTPTSIVALSETEPIIIGCNNTELVLMNHDGTGLTRITFDTLVQCRSQEFKESISPTGEWLVLRTGNYPESQASRPSNLALQIIKLPAGKIIKEIPLLSYILNKKIDEDSAWYLNDFIYPLLNTIPLWSPDGRYLAFVAALDGPSTDVYVYDAINDKTRRLTDGPNQAWLMSWSPDSQWIVHMEAKFMQFDHGATYGIPESTAVWRAAVNGRDVWKLYDTEQGGEPQIMGWISPREFVVQTQDLYPPYPYDLRIVDLISGRSEAINPCFGRLGDITSDGIVIFWSYGEDTQFLINDYFTEICKDTVPLGLYLLLNGKKEPIPGHLGGTKWFPELDKFIQLTSDGVRVMHSNGSPYLLFSEERCFPVFSPDGKWLAFPHLCHRDHSGSQKIRIYTSYGVLKREVVVDQAKNFFWDPKSSGVYFMVDKQIWYLSRFAGDPILVHPDIGVDIFVVAAN